MGFIRIGTELNPVEQKEICDFIKKRFKVQVEYCMWSPHLLVEEDEVNFYLKNTLQYKSIFKNKWSKSRKRLIGDVVNKLNDYDTLYNEIYEILNYDLKDYIDELIRKEIQDN